VDLVAFLTFTKLTLLLEDALIHCQNIQLFVPKVLPRKFRVIRFARLQEGPEAGREYVEACSAVIPVSLSKLR
jgi:hypothetical protein